MMTNGRKILIDTDIGDDVDDSFALYYAMRLGFDIVGITTVYRNTEARARLAKRLLCQYGEGYENVPVYAGYDLFDRVGEGEYPPFCQYSNELEKECYRPNGTAPEEAVDFILKCCKQYGKDLTLVAIGPFGNIAKAIQKDRAALEGIDRVVIMGGAFFKQYTDWNVMCDVPAADVMFRELNNLECLGADVTHCLELTEKERTSILCSENQSQGVKEIRSLYGMWERAKPNAKFVVHDALIIHYLSDPEVCSMESASIYLFTEGLAKGLTLNVDAYRHTFLNEAYRNFDFSKKTCIAKNVDRERFMKAFVASFR